ncbi:MAG: hypothetical protein EKK37_17475 [Sphingobacteriales bacterium]|nr:MAG: hypothetical protein EKK37_17475 [Sphingobacteriales bacterium]
MKQQVSPSQLDSSLVKALQALPFIEHSMNHYENLMRKIIADGKKGTARGRIVAENLAHYYAQYADLMAEINILETVISIGPPYILYNGLQT